MKLKLLLIAISLALLTGCGAAEELADQCGGDLGHVCAALFGSKNKEQDKRMSQIQDQLNANLEAMDIMLLNDDEFLQVQINALMVQTAQLASQQSAIAIIDFCGDYPGKLDEVGLKLVSGQIVAYFEGNDDKRHLAVLSPGNYETTDGTHCKFTISNSGAVTNQHY
jgi:hypothetical protein